MRSLTTNSKFRQFRRQPRNLLLNFLLSKRSNMKFPNLFAPLRHSRGFRRANDTRIGIPAKISQRKVAIDSQFSLTFEEGENCGWISPSRYTFPPESQTIQDNWVNSLAQDVDKNGQLTNSRGYSLEGDNYPHTSRCPPNIVDVDTSHPVNQFSSQSQGQVVVNLSDSFDIPDTTNDSSPYSEISPPPSPSTFYVIETEYDLEYMSKFLKDEGLENDIITFHGDNEHDWIILDFKYGIKWCASHPSVLFEGQALEVKESEDTDLPRESEENKQESSTPVSNFSAEEYPRLKNALMDDVVIFKKADDVYVLAMPKILIIYPFGNIHIVYKVL